MPEVNKLELFENNVSPEANTCLYSSYTEAHEGHSPVQAWLDSPRSVCGKGEEGNLCGQTSGGRDGVKMKFGSELRHRPCCCGNDGLCSAYCISIRSEEPSLLYIIRRSLKRGRSIKGLCYEGKM